MTSNSRQHRKQKHRLSDTVVFARLVQNPDTLLKERFHRPDEQKTWAGHIEGIPYPVSWLDARILKLIQDNPVEATTIENRLRECLKAENASSLTSQLAAIALFQCQSRISTKVIEELGLDFEKEALGEALSLYLLAHEKAPLLLETYTIPTRALKKVTPEGRNRVLQQLLDALEKVGDWRQVKSGNRPAIKDLDELFIPAAGQTGKPRNGLLTLRLNHTFMEGWGPWEKALIAGLMVTHLEEKLPGHIGAHPATVFPQTQEYLYNELYPFLAHQLNQMKTDPWESLMKHVDEARIQAFLRNQLRSPEFPLRPRKTPRA